MLILSYRKIHIKESSHKKRNLRLQDFVPLLMTLVLGVVEIVIFSQKAFFIPLSIIFVLNGCSKPKDKNFPYFRCPYIGLITTFLRVKPFEEFEGWKDYIKSNYNCNLVLTKLQGEPVIDLDTLTKLQAEAQMFDEKTF